MSRHVPPPVLYFRRAVPGVAATRYCIGHWEGRNPRVFVVTRTQLSVPDGQQVDPPSQVRYRTEPAATPRPARSFDE